MGTGRAHSQGGAAGARRHRQRGVAVQRRLAGGCRSAQGPRLTLGRHVRQVVLQGKGAVDGGARGGGRHLQGEERKTRGRGIERAGPGGRTQGAVLAQAAGSGLLAGRPRAGPACAAKQALCLTTSAGAGGCHPPPPGSWPGWRCRPGAGTSAASARCCKGGGMRDGWVGAQYTRHAGTHLARHLHSFCKAGKGATRQPLHRPSQPPGPPPAPAPT